MTFLKWTWRFIKAAKTLIIITLLLLSFSLNIAQFTGGLISGIASTAFHAVTGKRSVAAQHAIAVADINKQLDTERKSNRKLRKELANPKARIVTYKGKKMALSEAVEATSDSISRRAKRTAIREVGSMAGEALPLIGAAVIVSATALEIKDLCDTLKDMNALNVAFNPKSKPSEERVEERVTVCTMGIPTRKELLEKAKNSPRAAWDKTKGALAVAKANAPTVDDIKNYELPDIDWNGYLNKTTYTISGWAYEFIEGSKGIMKKTTGGENE